MAPFVLLPGFHRVTSRPLGFILSLTHTKKCDMVQETDQERGR